VAEIINLVILCGSVIVMTASLTRPWWLPTRQEVEDREWRQFWNERGYQ
jgi:hypothetical protein